MVKKLLICVFVLLGLFSSGCSYAHIKNTVGGPGGLTYEKTETTKPVSIKKITIKRVNGQLVIVREAK